MSIPPSLLALATVALLAGVCSAAGETVETSTKGEENATKPALTGDPQKDYLFDPNLPFELRGYNLSDYPFYDAMPKDITFKCDGLKDGFYASKPHKCQVYHHCLFGVRYDFLCANYTAFDQKNFICHFVSQVDCENSDKYWSRNDALYVQVTTSTTTTSGPPERVRAKVIDRPNRRRRPLRRRPFRRRRPAYDDYYYDDYYQYDDYDQYYDYYDYGEKSRPKGGRRRRPGSNRDKAKVEPVLQRDPSDPSRKGLFSRARPAPLIKPPIPLNARQKNGYDSNPAPPPPTASATEKPKKVGTINLDDIPFDDSPIPINENLVRDTEYERTSPRYEEEYPRKTSPPRRNPPTEAPPARYQSQNFRRYPGRHGVRTTTAAPPPPPVEEEEISEYGDYVDEPPARPYRRKPSRYRQQGRFGNGGFRRRRPYLQRSRLPPPEDDYPDTQGAASFTEIDAPVQRLKGRHRSRGRPAYQPAVEEKRPVEEPPQYEDTEPVYEASPPRRRNRPQQQEAPEPPPRRKPSFVLPPRRLQSRPSSKKSSPPTSPRERFPSRRRPSVKEEVVEEEPIEYTDIIPVEETPYVAASQNTRGDRNRQYYPSSRKQAQEQEEEVTYEEPPREEPQRRFRSPNYNTQNPENDRRNGFPKTNQRPPNNLPTPKKKTTPIRLEDIVFEEIPIGHPVANVRPGTFPISPTVPKREEPEPQEDHHDMLDDMPVGDLGKFSPPIHKRPTFRDPRPSHRQPPVSRPRQPFMRNQERHKEVFDDDVMDRPAPQVQRNRSQFPEASIFSENLQPRPVQRPPPIEEPATQDSLPPTPATRDGRDPQITTERRGGHFRFRIPVRASRRLVRDFFPNVDNL